MQKGEGCALIKIPLHISSKQKKSGLSLESCKEIFRQFKKSGIEEGFLIYMVDTTKEIKEQPRKLQYYFAIFDKNEVNTLDVWKRKNFQHQYFKVCELTPSHLENTITSMGYILQNHINPLMVDIYKTGIYFLSLKDLKQGDKIKWYGLYTMTYYMTHENKVYLMDVSGILRGWHVDTFNRGALSLLEPVELRNIKDIPIPKQEELERLKIPKWTLT